jgi:hypothetical protein
VIGVPGSLNSCGGNLEFVEIGDGADFGSEGRAKNWGARALHPCRSQSFDVPLQSVTRVHHFRRSEGCVVALCVETILVAYVASSIVLLWVGSAELAFV